MTRGRENQLLLAGVAAVVIVIAARILTSGSGSGGTAGPAAVATATPVVSEQAKAEAVALLGAAAQQRAAGQLGPALELGDQALATWPQYDAAQRFLLTAVPQATAVEQSAQAKATAAAQVAVTQAQAGAAARRVYSTKAGLSLQRYADALGGFSQKNREAREQPALLVDATWRFRTAAALATMQDAAGGLTALRPVPQDMAVSAALFTQLASETAHLREDYAHGTDDTGAPGVPFSSARTDHATDLVRQANVEIRRGVPPPAP